MLHISFSVVNDMNQTRFCWSEWEKSWTLGAFFYGYILFQIVGGSLAEKYGTKLVLGMAVLLTSILTFFIPLGAKKDFRILFAIRFLQGVVGSVTYPSLPPMIMR